MELSERCVRLCRHISALTGVHSTVLHIPTREFLLPPFHSGCAMEGNACSAVLTHLYGAYEAQRWDGKYIYYCPRGMVFLAALPRIPGEAMEDCIVIGPAILSNSAEDPFEDPFDDPDSLRGVPALTTAQAHALSELTALAAASFSLEFLPPDVDSGSMAEVLKMMYDDLGWEKHYPIEEERQLQEHIRSGDKEAAQKLLNELLAHIYSLTGNDLGSIKTRIRELLVLMNRAAIDGGADPAEIFSLCRQYDREVDSFTQIEGLNRWIGGILHQFMGFVFDFKAIKHQNVIFQTTAYIKAHLAEKLSLDQAAEQVYLSKSYFCRILKEELGCTFTEYVNRLRIERSKTLLRSSGMPIAEIACTVGFDDQSYFTRIFKKQMGVAPGRYREQRSRKSRQAVQGGRRAGQRVPDC